MRADERVPRRRRLHERVANVTSVPLENAEFYQVLRYEPGQFYRVNNDQNSPFTSAAGPRVFTFFTYLSNVTQGCARTPTP